MAGPFLRRRGAAYKFRARVPADIVPILGRVEVGRSLRTTDPRASKARARAIHAQLEVAWERIRVSMEQGTADTAWCIEEVEAALTVVEAQVRQFKAEATVAVREAEFRLATKEREAAEEQVATLARAREAVEEILAEQGREREQVQQERVAGTLDGKSLNALRSILGSAGIVMRSTPAPTALAFLEETFISEKNLQEDARRHMEGYVRLFAKVLGDKPLNVYTRAEILKWVKTLEQVRTTYGKGGKDKFKLIQAILKESKGKPTLGVTTIEKHVTHLKAFFLAATRHYRFATSDDVDAMFADIRLGANVPIAQERSIWPVAKLTQLFASPIWTGTRHGLDGRGRRHEAGPWVVLDSHWWLPVLGIFTGARLEELAQLQHSDLLEDTEERPFFYLNNEGGRRLKNIRSIRGVALHPFLLTLGVTRLFVSGKKGRIFPDLKQAGRPLKWSQQYSEDFTAYRRAVGLYEPLVDFHAFRHTFATAMRTKVGADPGLVGRMVGHQDTPELRAFRQTNGYTHFSIADQAVMLERLDWGAQGLDL